MARSPRSFDHLPLDSIKPDTRIRLEVAAHIAFPCGGITAASLRQEAKRGRLVVLRIAGRDFTTLQAVDEMCRLCQVYPALPDPSADDASRRPAVDVRSARAAAEMRVKRLKEKFG